MTLPKKNKSSKDTTTPSSMSWDDIMTPGANTGLTTDKQLGDFPKKERASKRKAVIIGIAVVLAIVIPMFLLLNHYAKERNAIIEQNLTTVKETPKRVESRVTPDTSSAYKNPAEDSTDVGDPAKGNTEGRVDGKKVILTSDGREAAFMFPSVKDKINGVSSKCVLDKTAENCYLGEATSSNGKTIKLWAFRDAKQSSLLSSTSDANIVSAGGAALAFTTKNVENGKKDNYLYIVLSNQTGVLAVTDDSVALDAMINGADAFQVQQG